MHKTKLIIFFAVISFAFFGGVGVARGEILISTSGTLSVSNETYKLTNDIVANGTAFTITAKDIIFDLNGYTITYNAQASASPVYGIYTPMSTADRFVIKNGTIIQGAGNSDKSSGIYIFGGYLYGPNELYNLIIKVNGKEADGFVASQGYSFQDSKIHNVFFETNGTTTDISSAPNCITVSETDGGIEIYDNICLRGHSGINLSLAGLGTPTAKPSKIYGNLIQQERVGGVKAPYGISLGKASYVSIYNNQIITDNGRGIMIDGWGNGVPEGSHNNNIYNNTIDVQYSTPATQGQYVENNVYGLAARYSSGYNTFDNNTVIATTLLTGADAGYVDGSNIGSDTSDLLSTNLTVSNNIFIVRDPGGQAIYGPIIFRWQCVNDALAINNKYYPALPFELINTCSVGRITYTNNTILNPIPSELINAPVGLKLTKFLDNYLLQWDKNLESDVFEYVVYRDGVKLPISSRGGTFYVDANVSGTHTYSLSALSFSGVESSRGSEISTNSAQNGWQSSPDTIPPSAPTGLAVI